MDEIETWKVISFPFNAYAINKLGQVKRVEGGRGAKINRILKNTIDKYGYPVVELHVSNKRFRRSIHTLLALTFITENIPEGYEVNHKDGNKLNHTLDNLEIVTRQQNVQHAWETGLVNNKGLNSKSRKLDYEVAEIIRQEYSYYNTTYVELVQRFYVSIATISRVINNKLWVKT
jgi:hypothetical protein